ncbi:MAG: hypothetical protein GY830_03070 [Bacteroidetes bacterium]|nr:hypothetical protein [Bacteroidota bacterium]
MKNFDILFLCSKNKKELLKYLLLLFLIILSNCGRGDDGGEDDIDDNSQHQQHLHTQTRSLEESTSANLPESNIQKSFESISNQNENNKNNNNEREIDDSKENNVEEESKESNIIKDILSKVSKNFNPEFLQLSTSVLDIDLSNFQIQKVMANPVIRSFLNNKIIDISSMFLPGGQPSVNFEACYDNLKDPKKFLLEIFDKLKSNDFSLFDLLDPNFGDNNLEKFKRFIEDILEINSLPRFLELIKDNDLKEKFLETNNLKQVVNIMRKFIVGISNEIGDSTISNFIDIPNKKEGSQKLQEMIEKQHDEEPTASQNIFNSDKGKSIPIQKVYSGDDQITKFADQTMCSFVSPLIYLLKNDDDLNVDIKKISSWLYDYVNYKNVLESPKSTIADKIDEGLFKNLNISQNIKNIVKPFLKLIFDFVQLAVGVLNIPKFFNEKTDLKNKLKDEKLSKEKFDDFLESNNDPFIIMGFPEVMHTWIVEPTESGTYKFLQPEFDYDQNKEGNIIEYTKEELKQMCLMNSNNAQRAIRNSINNGVKTYLNIDNDEEIKDILENLSYSLFKTDFDNLCKNLSNPILQILRDNINNGEPFDYFIIQKLGS